MRSTESRICAVEIGVDLLSGTTFSQRRAATIKHSLQKIGYGNATVFDAFIGPEQIEFDSNGFPAGSKFQAGTQSNR